MTTTPKIVTSNKMANNVWEVNERCSVFHLLFANDNFNNEDDKEQGICIEKDYFVILYNSFKKFTL